MDTTPTSADALVQQADSALGDLLRHADALPDHAVSDEFAGERVADVLAHLHGWHVLLLAWLEAADFGDEPEVPAPGYDWDHLADLNAALLAEHAQRPYDELRALLVDSHGRACAAVRDHDDDLLFDPAARPWLGGQSLGDVAHECLAAHYAWGETALGQCAT